MRQDRLFQWSRMGWLLVVLFLGLAPERVCGQNATAERKVENSILRIRRVEGLGRKGFVKSPVYTTNCGNGENEPQDWWCLAVDYDTARPATRGESEWMDGLNIEYFVLLLRRDGKDNKYAFLKTRVSYSDIQRGGRHKSTVYLHPKTVARHGLPVAVGVEITYGGKPLAEFADADQGAKLPSVPRWWKNAKIVESPNVAKLDGQLLDRSKTPFALVHIDDYEVIR